jgi:hypothetical protein
MQGGALIALSHIVAFAIHVKPCAAAGVQPMHSAIIVVEPPKTESDKIRWQSFASAIAEVCKHQGVEQLAENVWLINFQEAPVALARLVAAAHQHDFSQRILQLPEQPNWIQADAKIRNEIRQSAWVPIK